MNQVRAIDIRLLGKKRTGDETVFFNLTKELLAFDREHEYLLLTDESDTKTLTEIRDRLGCAEQKNVRLVTLRGRNRFIWNLFTVPWFLLRQPVVLYHTQYILPLFVPRRTKVVLHIHDVSFRAFPKLIGWRDRFFLSLFIPHALRRATAIVTPSRFTKDELVRYYRSAPEKITVIPNALSEDFLVDENTTREKIREKYHLPERFILNVGTLQPRKNLPLLIRALARVRTRLPDVALVLTGNREGHHIDPDISRAITELGLSNAVHFAGYVEQRDLPGLVRAATLFAFPSWYEGFGIPLLEAMSQNVPIVCSDTPCLREVARDAALYFDPASIASCEESLYTLLTDETRRGEKILRGKNRLMSYSWQKSAELLSRLYDALV